jgi:hypothetical protein
MRFHAEAAVGRTHTHAEAAVGRMRSHAEAAQTRTHISTEAAQTRTFNFAWAAVDCPKIGMFQMKPTLLMAMSACGFAPPRHAGLSRLGVMGVFSGKPKRCKARVWTLHRFGDSGLATYCRLDVRPTAVSA